MGGGRDLAETQIIDGPFSAVSKPIFPGEGSLESARRYLYDNLIQSHTYDLRGSELRIS